MRAVGRERRQAACEQSAGVSAGHRLQTVPAYGKRCISFCWTPSSGTSSLLLGGFRVHRDAFRHLMPPLKQASRRVFQRAASLLRCIWAVSKPSRASVIPFRHDRWSPDHVRFWLNRRRPMLRHVHHVLVHHSSTSTALVQNIIFFAGEARGETCAHNATCVGAGGGRSNAAAHARGGHHRCSKTPISPFSGKVDMCFRH